MARIVSVGKAAFEHGETQLHEIHQGARDQSPNTVQRILVVQDAIVEVSNSQLGGNITAGAAVGVPRARWSRPYAIVTPGGVRTLEAAECFRQLDLWRFRRNVGDTLALHRRGEVRNDGLKLDGVSSHLEIRWRAREIHPWDRDLLRGGRKQAAFAEQALADTEAAI